MLAQTTYGTWSPPQLSVHGAAIDNLINIVHYFMALLFVAWGLFFIYCLVRFRARSGHEANYNLVKGKISKYAEVAVAAFEVFLLFGLSVPVWGKYKNDPPAAGERVEVRVVAEQFLWNFHYPGPDGVFGQTKAELIDLKSNPLGIDRDNDPNAKDDIYSGELHVPVGKDVYCMISSKDVIHSFFIPVMRVKQDAVPGMVIPIWFKVQDDATSATLLEKMDQQFPIAKLNWYRLRRFVAVEDIKDPNTGDVLIAKDASLGANKQAGDETIARLQAAFKNEATDKTITMRPYAAMEVVCAQLCGNEHYSMAAKMVTHSPSDFEAWVAEEAKKAKAATEGMDFEF